MKATIASLDNGRNCEKILRWLFGSILLLRLLYPFFNSPLTHLFSDPQRHWENGINFLNPSPMGGQDPFLYQFWMYLLQHAGAANPASIPLCTGLLCALMPYGWYRTLKELLPRNWALGGAILIGLIPEFLGIYAYFMNETLFLSLTGLTLWLTLRTKRKHSVSSFALACAGWLALGFTQAIALPLGLGCLAWLWLTQTGKIARAVVGSILLAIFIIPAGYHARSTLHYFSPFGNVYLNDIYRASGKKVINVDFGPNGHYSFGSPSYFIPTLYPFSDWLTDRTDAVSIHVDLTQGRKDWIAEETRVARERTFPFATDVWENLLYLCFGQVWPNNDQSTLVGWLTVWSRWLWLPLIGFVAYGAWERQIKGREWLLPLSALSMFAFLLVQQNAIMEARYRMPLDPMFVASAVIMLYRRRVRAREEAPREVGSASNRLPDYLIPD